MKRKVEELIRWSRRRCFPRRAVALMSAVTLLLTMVTFDLPGFAEAERRAYCGLETHRHEASCYDGDALACGLEEHAHAPECYVAPKADAEDAVIYAEPVDEIREARELELVEDAKAPEETAESVEEAEEIDIGDEDVPIAPEDETAPEEGQSAVDGSETVSEAATGPEVIGQEEREKEAEDETVDAPTEQNDKTEETEEETDKTGEAADEEKETEVEIARENEETGETEGETGENEETGETEAEAGENEETEETEETVEQEEETGEEKEEEETAEEEEADGTGNEASPEDEISYPAQRFEQSALNVRVSVNAAEGAFPEGTTMAINRVWDRDTLSDIREAVAEDFVAVRTVTAVDITFFDAEGREIEPLIPIEVAIAVAEIQETQSAVLVHVDDDGNAEVVEQTAETAEGDTQLTAEMPAGEEVRFESESFSVYAVVVTEVLETRYIAADGGTYNIRLTYGPEAGIPAGAALRVREVSAGDYLSRAEAALDDGVRIEMARFFDIAIVAEGREVEPAVPVEVSVTLDAYAEGRARAIHFADDGGVDVLSAEKGDAGVVFSADSFSVYGVAFTVEFEYHDVRLNINGNSDVLLSVLMRRLDIDLDIDDVSDVVFSDPALVRVTAEEGDWRITSLRPFNTRETLTIRLRDRSELIVRVTDDQTQDLTPFLTKVEIFDQERLIGGSEDGEALLRKSRDYDLYLTFAEEELGRQFIDTGVMRMVLPEAISLPVGQSDISEFEINMGRGHILRGNVARYVPAGAVVDGEPVSEAYIEVTWNEQGGKDYELLTYSPRAIFRLHYKVNIDTEVQALSFSDSVTVPVGEDPEYTVTAEKTLADYDNSTGIATYNVVIQADGNAKDVEVTDTLGAALSYITDPGLSVAYTNKNGGRTRAYTDNLVGPSYGVNDEGQNTFELKLKTLDGGDRAVLTYAAKVDFSQLNKNNVAEVTGNHVSAKVRNVAPATAELNLEDNVDYLAIQKVEGEKEQLEDGTYLVPWTVTYNPERRLSVYGAQLKDTIYTGAVNAANYYSDEIHPFTVKVYSDGTYTERRNDEGEVTQWSFTGDEDHCVATLEKQFSDPDITVTPYEAAIQDAEDSDRTDNHTSWSWSIPAIDGHDTAEAFTYVITYYTLVDPARASKDFFGNRVEEDKADETSSQEHTIAESHKPKLSVGKEVLDTQADYVKWRISFERPINALSRAVVEDALPGTDTGLRDSYVDESGYETEVTGLYAGEGYNVSETRNGRVIFTFHYTDADGAQVQGLKGADDTHTQITITYYTRNNPEWMQGTEDGSLTHEHNNTVRLILDDREARHTVTATPKEPKLIKRVKEDGEIISVNGIHQPVYRYTLKLVGLDDDMFRSGQLVIHDEFDRYFTRVSASDLVDWSDNSAATHFTGSVNGRTDDRLVQTIPSGVHEGDTVSVDIADAAGSSADKKGLTFTVDQWTQPGNTEWNPWREKDATTKEYVGAPRYGYSYEITYYLMIAESDLQRLARDQYAADGEAIDGAQTEDDRTDIMKNGGSMTLRNTARVDGSAVELASGEVKVDVDVKPVKKTMNWDQASELATYTIVVNERKLELNGGAPYKLEDKYENLAVDFGTIRFETDPAGAAADIDFTYHSNVGTFWLPDSTKVTIIYRAWPVGKQGDSVNMSNTASVESYISTADRRVTLTADHEGSAESYGVRVLKYSNDNMNKALGGAVFQLLGTDEDGNKVPLEYRVAHHSDTESADWTHYDYHRADGSAYPTPLNHEAGDEIYFITSWQEGDDKGFADIMLSQARDGLALRKGVRYYLREVQAPEGYTKEYTDWQFIIEDYDDFNMRIYSNGNVLQIANPSVDRGLVVEKDFYDHTGLVTYSDHQKYVEFEIVGRDDQDRMVYYKVVPYGDFKVVDDAVTDAEGNTTVHRSYKLIIAPDELKPGRYTVTEKKAEVDNTRLDTTVQIGDGDAAHVKVAAFTWREGENEEIDIHFTNTYTDAVDTTIEVAVQKVWADNVSAMPDIDSVIFDLYRTTDASIRSDMSAAALRAFVSANRLSPVESNLKFTRDGDSWVWCLEKADRISENGDYYIYFALERAMEGFEDSYAMTGEPGESQSITITNTATIPTTDFTFGKLWVGPNRDQDDDALVWPDDRAITVEIHRREKGERTNSADERFKLVYTVKKGADGVPVATYDDDSSVHPTGEAMPTLSALPVDSYNQYQFILDGLAKYKEGTALWQYYAVEQAATDDEADVNYDVQYGYVDGIVVTVVGWADAAARETPGSRDTDKVAMVENIINRAVPTVTWPVNVQKLISGDARNLHAGEFTFELYQLVKGADNAVTQRHIAYAKNDESGAASFEIVPDMSRGLTYHARRRVAGDYVDDPYFDGTYTYYIREVQPGEVNDAEGNTQPDINGVTFTNVTARLDYRVTLDWVSGSITAVRLVSFSDGRTLVTDDALEFTNTYDEGDRPLTLGKLWDDDGNRDGKRGNVTFKVVCTAEAAGLTETRTFEVPFNRNGTAAMDTANRTLPVYIDSYPVTRYEISEVTWPDGYTPVAAASDPITIEPEDDTDENGRLSLRRVAFTAENRHDIEDGPTRITLTKTWADDGDRDGYRPDADAYRDMVWLYAPELGVIEVLPEDMTVADNGDDTYTVTITKGRFTRKRLKDDGSYETYQEVMNLPKYTAPGKLIQYTVIEAPVEHYSADGTGVKVGGEDRISARNTNDATAKILTNTHDIDRVSLTLTKRWSDADNQDGLRPGRGGQDYLKYVTLYAAYGGGAPFKVYENGVWVSGADEILRDIAMEARVTLTGAGEKDTDYTVRFTGLPANRKGAINDAITYTLAEERIDAYRLEDHDYAAAMPLTDGALAIENTHTPATVSVTANKRWVHRGHVLDGAISATLRLVATLPEDGGENAGEAYDFAGTAYADAAADITRTWQTQAASEIGSDFVWTGLPKYAPGYEGRLLSYTVEEVCDNTHAVPDGYHFVKGSSGVDGDGNTTINITNEYEATELTLTKLWLDANNRDGMRGEVTFKLQRKLGEGGSFADVSGGSRTLDATGTSVAQHTQIWTGLPSWIDNQKVSYRVVEVTPEGYEKSEGSAVETGPADSVYSVTETITNTHEPDDTAALGFTKVWEDLGDGRHPTPDQYKDYLRLYARVEGEEPVEVAGENLRIAPEWRDNLTVTEDAQGRYAVRIANLPRYMIDRVGMAITWQVREDAVDRYAADREVVLDGETLTNTHKTAQLTITKTVNSDLASDANERFEFTVTTQPAITGSYAATGADADTVSFANGVADGLRLKHGGTITLSGLPTGVTYTVTEARDARFTVTADGAVGNAGTVAVDKDDETNHTAAFTNTRVTGDLVLSKRVVSPVDDDKNHDFLFRVTLKDTTIDKTYSGVRFTGGVSELIRLRDGGEKRIEGLPTDLEYSVEEVSGDDDHEAEYLDCFERTATLEGAIASGDNPAAFTNTRRYVPVRLCKVDAENPDKLLGEAEFILSWTEDGASRQATLVSSADEHDKGQLLIRSAVQSAMVVPVGDSGVLNLANGVYMLTETEAPGGYKKLIGDVTVTVADFRADIRIDDQGEVLTIVAPTELSADNEIVTVKVPDLPGSEFPTTGGKGTALYTAAGLALLALAFALLLRRRGA